MCSNPKAKADKGTTNVKNWTYSACGCAQTSEEDTLTGEAGQLSLPSLSSMTDVVANSTLGEIPYRERDNSTFNREMKTKGQITALPGTPIYNRKSSIYASLEINKLQKRERLQ